MFNALLTLCFANYYGFDKVAREGSASTAERRGYFLCTQQVLLLTLNLVYGVALALPPGSGLHVGVVVASCLAAGVANYFGVLTSARYPAFRTRMDRQPFALKFGLVLCSFTTAVAAIPGFIWLVQRYYQAA